MILGMRQCGDLPFRKQEAFPGEVDDIVPDTVQRVYCSHTY